MTERYTHTAQELVDRVDGAWEDVYTKASPLIKMILGKLGVPEEEMDDLLQDTLIRTLGALPRLHPQDNPTTYIARVATNIGIDHLRAKGRRIPTYSLDGLVNRRGEEIDQDVVVGIADPSRTPEERVIQQEEVEEVLNKLRPQERRLFILRSQGYRIHELGGGQAKSVLFRAREKLDKEKRAS